MSGKTEGPEPEAVIRVTPAALAMVRETRAREREPDGLALWLEVNGSAAGAYTYDLWFGPEGAIGPGDARQGEGDLAIVVPAASVARVRGALLDVSADDEPGLVIVNANTPPSWPSTTRPQVDLSGAVARRVLEVLEEEVNPQIALHGGRADLVAVEGSTAYVELSGGCHGCGMARATLSQGVAVIITDAVAQISEVVDVTDHSSGTSPFYERAFDEPGRSAVGR